MLPIPLWLQLEIIAAAQRAKAALRRRLLDALSAVDADAAADMVSEAEHERDEAQESARFWQESYNGLKAHDRAVSATRGGGGVRINTTMRF